MDEKMLLKLQELSWQPDKKNKVLNNISTVFETGGFYGIIGPNGSGKTSLMKHVLRFLEVQSGSIYLNKKTIAGYSRNELARKLSLVPQNTNVETSFTVYDMVAMGRNPYRKFLSGLENSDKLAVEEAIRLTGCTDLRDKAFSELSGGEAQRVITARAIAQDTPWMILDEPIAHLDVRYQVELMKTLKYLNEIKQKTVIAVLHDLNLAASYCSRLVLMKQGAIYAEGSIKEVLTSENLREVYGIEFSMIQNEKNGQVYYVPV